VDSVFAEGEAIFPARITSAAGRQFAAMQLITTNLSFALECLTTADKIVVPDQSDLNSKSLIFAAAVGYAWPFKTGVREIKLDCEMFAGAVGFDAEYHKFLIALRDRHVAHSEFERCEAVAIIVETPETGWRDGRWKAALRPGPGKPPMLAAVLSQHGFRGVFRVAFGERLAQFFHGPALDLTDSFL
jgi:hypothetical protein